MTQLHKKELEVYIRTLQKQKLAGYPVGMVIFNESERKKVCDFLESIGISVTNIGARTNLSFFNACQDDHFLALSVQEESSKFFLHVMTELADTGVVDTRFPMEHEQLYFNTAGLETWGMVFLMNEEQFEKNPLAQIALSAYRIIK